MHRYSASSSDETHDLVARHRSAAARQPHHDVVETFDVDARAGVVTAARTRRPGDGRGQLLLTTAQLSLDALDDGLGRDVALTDARVQAIEIGVVELLGDIGQHGRARELLDRQRLATHRLDQILASGVDRVDAPLA